MGQIVRYNCAATEGDIPLLSDEDSFETLEEAELYSEKGWKSFKITITIEEVT